MGFFIAKLKKEERLGSLINGSDKSMVVYGSLNSHPKGEESAECSLPPN